MHVFFIWIIFHVHVSQLGLRFILFRFCKPKQFVIGIKNYLFIVLYLSISAHPESFAALFTVFDRQRHRHGVNPYQTASRGGLYEKDYQLSSFSSSLLCQYFSFHIFLKSWIVQNSYIIDATAFRVVVLCSSLAVRVPDGYRQIIIHTRYDLRNIIYKKQST